MPGLQIALIADDLTGALDSAAPFAMAGWRTLIATAPDRLAATLAHGPEVIAVSLNSREGPKAQAAALAAQATRALASAPRLFKKIDSRMKGHIGAELTALLQVRPHDRVILCPAIPELGRVLRAGHVEGLGIASPIPVAGVLDLPCQTPDAQTDHDLDRIVAKAEGALLVGARGLAAALARAGGQRPPRAISLPAPPLVFVVGSRDPVSLAQVAALKGRLDHLFCPDGVVPARAPGPALLLQATEGPGATGARVAQSLARGAAPHVRASRIAVLTGGETAAALLSEMAIGTLELLGEVETGLPLSRPLDLPLAPCLVTKSGGFGDAQSLARLLTRVTREKASA